MKELSKRLPVDAICYLCFSRSVVWLEAARQLGVKPDVANEFLLRISVLRDGKEDRDTFDFKGKSLKDVIRELDVWIVNRKRLSVALAPKQLPAVIMDGEKNELHAREKDRDERP